jgi:hypothetical protein
MIRTPVDFKGIPVGVGPPFPSLGNITVEELDGELSLPISPPLVRTVVELEGRDVYDPLPPALELIWVVEVFELPLGGGARGPQTTDEVELVDEDDGEMAIATELDVDM